MHNNTAKTLARVLAGVMAALMILSLLLSLVGCGSDTEAQPGEDKPETESTDTPETTPETKPEEDKALAEEEEEVPEEPSEEEEETPAEEEEEAPSEEEPKEEEPAEPSEPSQDTPAAPEQPAPSEPEAPVQPETPAEPVPVSPDENGMMQVGDSWIQDPGALNESSIQSFGKKLQNIKSNYLAGAANISWSIIPDKSNYAADKVTSSLNHSTMVSKAKAALSGWNYVEIGDLLTFDDYLLTDGHWRQERIVPAANRLASAFGFSVSKGSFTQKSAAGFGGDYAKYSGTTENISWMESSHTAATVCENFQNPGRTAVYDASLIKTISPYDLFSGGPTPLVTLKNSAVESGKKLVIFRDSFGSSMAPLLLGGYSEIVLVDLRYMASSLIPQYVTFDGADVLFLFSARVVNNSQMLR